MSNLAENYSGITIDQNQIPNVVTTLSGLISGSVFALPVVATTVPLVSGATVATTSGSNTQTWVVSGTAAIGATSIPVVAQTANTTYPIGTGLYGSGLAYAGFLPATPTWVYQSFSLPPNYVRGTYTSEQSYPDISGFQLLATVASGQASSASLNWTIDYYINGSGWSNIETGTITGTQADSSVSPLTWVDVFFPNTVSVGPTGEVPATSLFRIGVQVEAGITGLWFSQPNPVSGTAFTYANNTQTNLTYSGNPYSLCYRILSLSADNGVDFLGDAYRAVVVQNAPENTDTTGIVLPSPSTYWMSDPCPSRFGVKSLYHDLRPVPELPTYSTINLCGNPSFEYDPFGSTPFWWITGGTAAPTLKCVGTVRPTIGVQALQISGTSLANSGTCGIFSPPFLVNANTPHWLGATISCTLPANTSVQHSINWFVSTTTLSGSMQTTGTTTSLSVNPTPAAITTGSTAVVISGNYVQTFTVSGASTTVASGSTTIPVIAQTANYAYPIGATIGTLSGSTTNTITGSGTTLQSFSGTSSFGACAAQIQIVLANSSGSAKSFSCTLDEIQCTQGPFFNPYGDGDFHNWQWGSQKGRSASIQFIPPVTSGDTATIDSVMIDPITTGVGFNVYYSTDDANNVGVNPPATDDGWDEKLWIRVPRTFKLTKRQQYVFPHPIVAKYIKLEFTDLQPKPYNPGNFPKPVSYKKFPKWVVDFFEGRIFFPDFIASQVRVFYDALGFGYNNFLDDIHWRPEDSSLFYTSPGNIPIGNFYAKDLTDFVDPVTLRKINLTFNPYVFPPTFQADPTTLLGASRALFGSGNPTYPVEEGPRTANVDFSFVSSLNRDRLVWEFTFPTMYFWLTCRHFYKQVSANFEHNRAYFAGINSIAFMRNTYSTTSDTPKYLECGNDTINSQYNDWVIDFNNNRFTY